MGDPDVNSLPLSAVLHKRSLPVASYQARIKMELVCGGMPAIAFGVKNRQSANNIRTLKTIEII